MLSAIIKAVGLVLLIVVFMLIMIFFVQMIIVTIKNKGLKHYGIKRRWKHKLYHLRYHKFVKYADFVKWCIIDMMRGKVKIKLFGIWCFTGYFGQGKTLGAVTYALKVKKDLGKIGKQVHIYTNFNMVGQDGKISSWEQLLKLPKCTIVIFDEIQSTFTSQKFKDFPIELLWKITQCRKQELCIFASSPVFSRMSIQLRENTDYVITCKNFLNLDRFFSYGFYRAPEYEMYQENPVKLFRSKVRTFSFVASDKDYRAYNTHEIVDRLDITGEEEKQTIVKRFDYNRVLKECYKYIDEKIKKLA
jgi:hypothetical protein